jgi:hypothetical protein
MMRAEAVVLSPRSLRAHHSFHDSLCFFFSRLWHLCLHQAHTVGHVQLSVQLTMSLPQPLHLSAALTLVESKPKHLTIQGDSLSVLPNIPTDSLPAYIQSLRDSIEKSHHDGRDLRHLNLSTFWRKQHDDLHDTLEKERDAVFVLQKEKEALQAQNTDLLARSKPGRKRKSDEQEEPVTAKKIKAGTMAIAEFGCAADVDPGLTSQYLVRFQR